MAWLITGPRADPREQIHKLINALLNRQEEPVSGRNITRKTETSLLPQTG